jgi:hypothetical protein
MQQSMHITDMRLQRVEEAHKLFGEAHHKMDKKIDSIYKLLSQWHSSSVSGIAPGPNKPLTYSLQPVQTDMLHGEGQNCMQQEPLFNTSQFKHEAIDRVPLRLTQIMRAFRSTCRRASYRRRPSDVDLALC